MYHKYRKNTNIYTNTKCSCYNTAFNTTITQPNAKPTYL